MLAAAEAARQQAEDEVKARTADVQQLRTVMEEYVEQIQAAQEAGEGEDAAALRMELAMVRQQAAEEVARLKQDAGGGAALDQEALRQQLATLEQNLQERQRELEEAAEHRLMVEESLEDANRQIDELRRTMDQAKVEAEEAVFQREEAEQARRQLEQTLQKYQEDAVEADALDLRDERIKPSRGALDMGAVGGLSKGSLVLGLFGGAGLLIGGLELALWLGGKGELFALLFGGN
jgi:chromosome segregation ATPase